MPGWKSLNYKTAPARFTIGTSASISSATLRMPPPACTAKAT
ncbi:MAG: hypothetical protein AAB316_24385 [Bacteroidota bacterium]